MMTIIPRVIFSLPGLLSAGVVAGIAYSSPSITLGAQNPYTNLNKATRFGSYFVLGGTLTELIGKVSGLGVLGVVGKSLMALGSGVILGAQCKAKRATGEIRIITQYTDKTAERLFAASAVTLLTRIGFGLIS